MSLFQKIFLVVSLLATGGFAFGQDMVRQKQNNTTKVDNLILPKDSMPDLWIVTIDVSISMRENANVRQGLSSVPKKVQNLISSHSKNKEKNTYVLQRSGAHKDNLLAKNNINNKISYSGDELVNDLIHQTQIFNKTNNLINQLNRICRCNQDMYYYYDEASIYDIFVYNMSFTSLVRPLSIYEIANRHRVDFSQYNKIYHILITDDGDNNDQWMQDYKWMKKYARKHFDRYNEILNSVACSEFDFTSRKVGKFIEIDAITHRQPHVYLTEYVTYQNNHPDRVLPADSLIEVFDFHDNAVSFSLKEDIDSTIDFVYIDSCYINGYRIPVNQYLYPDEVVNVYFDRSIVNFFKNQISIKGNYQEAYQDRTLGLRHRTVALTEGLLYNNYVTAENKDIENKVLASIVGLLVLAALFILVLRNIKILHIYINGKHWCIKRKALHKLKYDNYTLASVCCSENTITGVLFYLDKGITVKDDTSVTKKGEQKLVVRSYKKLHLNNERTDFLLSNNSLRNLVFEEAFKGGKLVQFSYSDHLSHGLIIQFNESETATKKRADNPLQNLNLEMLATYYEKNAGKINTTRNNVMVNFIKKDAIAEGEYISDYAVLNIFDTYSQNSANRIFLRYSLMCFLEHKVNANNAFAYLLEIARKVLKDERQKIGYVETKPYTASGLISRYVEVDTAPLLSYLFLLKKGKSRKVYSPFKDGNLKLTSKNIELFPRKGMILKNIAVGYSKLDYGNERGGTNASSMEYSPQNLKYADLVFEGNGRIRFLGTSKDFSYGHPEPYHKGITYYSYPLFRF